jgi:hypothetical protein
MAPLPISQEGKWPEYAAAITLYAHNHSIRLPRQLGPCRLSEFSPGVKAFCEQKLFPVLTDQERARRDKAEGHWPGYASELGVLARRHQMQIPGTGLPGPPAFWDRFRAQPRRPGDLPEIPDKTLMDFVRNGMTEAERGALPSHALGDPQIREKIKQLYFERNPADLKRLRQSDLRKQLDRDPLVE